MNALLSAVLLFQMQAPKPLIENARVVVWEGQAAGATFVRDTVTVSDRGDVAYLAKGEKTKAAKLIVELKPEPVAPIPNPSGFALALPRPGSKLVLDNTRVAVWDYTWTLGVPTPMHFHDKDVVVMFLKDGDLKSTTPSGGVTVNPYKAGTIRFNARDRVHTEELIRGEQRAIIIELK